MSFGMSSFFTEFTSYGGATKSLFDVIYDIFYDTILPLNGLIVCLFVMHRWRQSPFNEEVAMGDPKFQNSLMRKYINFSVKTFIPVVLLAIFVNTVALKFFGFSFI